MLVAAHTGGVNRNNRNIEPIEPYTKVNRRCPYGWRE